MNLEKRANIYLHFRNIDDPDRGHCYCLPIETKHARQNDLMLTYRQKYYLKKSIFSIKNG